MPKISVPSARQPRQLLVQAQNLSLEVNGRRLLDDITFDLAAGQILTVIGPNGAGKTTLLRVLLGLQPGFSGRLWLHPELRIGYMPQRLAIDPSFPLSVHRFITLTTPFPRHQVEQALAEVGASQVIDHPVQRISGGELQRVLLARALLREPDLLVLDEPIQGVDVHGQAELYLLLGRLRDERGCTILLVSHDLHLVMAATDRVLCLNRHLCCTGTPEAVVRCPEFIAMFGPQVGESLAVYRHREEHNHNHPQAVRTPE